MEGKCEGYNTKERKLMVVISSRGTKRLNDPKRSQDDNRHRDPSTRASARQKLHGLQDWYLKRVVGCVVGCVVDCVVDCSSYRRRTPHQKASCTLAREPDLKIVPQLVHGDDAPALDRIVDKGTNTNVDGAFELENFWGGYYFHSICADTDGNDRFIRRGMWPGRNGCLSFSLRKSSDYFDGDWVIVCHDAVSVYFHLDTYCGGALEKARGAAI